MRLIILSDSHGDAVSCEMAIRNHPDAAYIIHLGDGEDDLDRINSIFLNKRIVRVKGNCSWNSIYRAEQIFEVCGKKIFCCHGHTRNVKVSTELLKNHAAAMGCELALYGHTHTQKYDFLPIPLHVFNPGSIRRGYYGLVDISPDGIICTKMQL